MVGASDKVTEGWTEGALLGVWDKVTEGWAEGSLLGALEAVVEGRKDGTELGTTEGVVVGNSINTVDPTSVAALTIGANNLSVSVNRAVNSRIGDIFDSKSIYKNEEGEVWTKIFGNSFERGDDFVDYLQQTLIEVINYQKNQ